MLRSRPLLPLLVGTLLVGAGLFALALREAHGERHGPRALAGLLLAPSVGVVVDDADPDRSGRVKVHFPWLPDTKQAPWARLSVPLGTAPSALFVPEVGDEVLVAFLDGDPDRPVIVGLVPSGP